MDTGWPSAAGMTEVWVRGTGLMAFGLRRWPAAALPRGRLPGGQRGTIDRWEKGAVGYDADAGVFGV